MIIGWSKDIFNDTRLLPGLAIEVFREFVSLALQRLSGSALSPKLFERAAQSLGVDAAAVESAVDSLAMMFIEFNRRNISEADLLFSLDELLLTEAQRALLASEYSEAAPRLRLALNELASDFPRYHDFEWRLDVCVASRMMKKIAEPSFLLKFTTVQPATVGQQEATVAATIMESDYANLSHLCEVVEAAVKEIGSKHVKRVIRYVK